MLACSWDPLGGGFGCAPDPDFNDISGIAGVSLLITGPSSIDQLGAGRESTEEQGV